MTRIAIFLDGTWNTLENNTNVWRLKTLCDPNDTGQLVYYGRGVGTAIGEHYRGGATGLGIDREILEAYEWLVQIFQPNDEVFIFGFSRGAYAVRSLSGLIAKCGILQPGAPLSIEQLYARYKLYSAPTLATILADGAVGVDLEERWMAKYCFPAKIRFLGVWDTVGSVGSPLSPLRRRVKKYRFLDTHLRKQNEFAFHALALDEHRRTFEPTFWTRSVDNAAAASPARPLSQVEQRWFVGAHANVGGGYASDVLAQPPLKWIMDKARQAGLAFRPGFSVEPVDPSALIADSYAAFTPRLLRPFFPRFNRVVGAEPYRGTERTTSRINETIDESVFERWRSNPAYRPPSLSNWSKSRGVDPASMSGSVRADNPAEVVP
jgi:uncharacterized protein (DUF2235 family)